MPNSMDDDRVPIPKDDEEDIISSYLDGDHDDAPHKVCSIILLNSMLGCETKLAGLGWMVYSQLSCLMPLHGEPIYF